LNAFITSQDAPGLWNHLAATYSQATNKQFIIGVLRDFYNGKYNPPNDTIDAFATRLREAQKKLADTNNALTDDALHMQLVMGLPDTNKRQVAQQFALHQFTKFEKAVTYFETIERENLSESDNANVNAANHRGTKR